MSKTEVLPLQEDINTLITIFNTFYVFLLNNVDLFLFINVLNYSFLCLILTRMHYIVKEHTSLRYVYSYLRWYKFISSLLILCKVITKTKFLSMV
jgi:predicted ferric reductase